MKKIELKFAAQRLSKEQMKKIGGGGDPVCNGGTLCSVYDDFGEPVFICVCEAYQGSCVCAADGAFQENVNCYAQ